MLYDVPAPAKINLFLHVVGRRADGYHLLQSLFQFIDFCDVLHFDSRSDGKIERTSELPGVPADRDLCVRAASLLQQACGVREGVTIGLEKHIPTGGGLGGGSSDAASTLLALNRLWRCHLSRSELMRLAATLGADVPVFVFGQTAFAQGVGDDLAAVDFPSRAFVVAQPQIEVPTATVFGASDLTRDTNPITITDFAIAPEAMVRVSRNDLQPVACRMYAPVQDGLNLLSQAASVVADGFSPLVRMSGSGACVFAWCENLPQAALVKKEITDTMRVVAELSGSQFFRTVRACSGLYEHPLRHWVAD